MLLTLKNVEGQYVFLLEFVLVFKIPENVKPTIRMEQNNLLRFCRSIERLVMSDVWRFRRQQKSDVSTFLMSAWQRCGDLKRFVIAVVTICVAVFRHILERRFHCDVRRRRTFKGSFHCDIRRRSEWRLWSIAGVTVFVRPEEIRI